MVERGGIGRGLGVKKKMRRCVGYLSCVLRSCQGPRFVAHGDGVGDRRGKGKEGKGKGMYRLKIYF